MKTRLTSLILSSLFVTGVAVAGSVDFDKLDQDGNGALTRAEAAANPAVLAKFDDADANGDGELSKKEVKDAMSKDDKKKDRDSE